MEEEEEEEMEEEEEEGLWGLRGGGEEDCSSSSSSSSSQIISQACSSFLHRAHQVEERWNEEKEREKTKRRGEEEGIPMTNGSLLWLGGEEGGMVGGPTRCFGVFFNQENQDGTIDVGGKKRGGEGEKGEREIPPLFLLTKELVEEMGKEGRGGVSVSVVKSLGVCELGWASPFCTSSSPSSSSSSSSSSSVISPLFVPVDEDEVFIKKNII